MRISTRITCAPLLLLLGGAAMSACSSSAKQIAEGDEPIAALEVRVRSVRYDAAYWRGQAVDGTAVWSIAIQYCGTDYRLKLAQQPNCRRVLRTAVDLMRERPHGEPAGDPESEQPPEELIYVVEERRTVRVRRGIARLVPR